MRLAMTVMLIISDMHLLILIVPHQDVGGASTLRRLWRHYFSGTEGLIYVIDCADRERIGVAIEEFYCVIGDEEMKNAVILVFANKQDQPTGMMKQLQ